MTIHTVVAGLLAFFSTFTLYALNLIAQEIEQPFGEDDNDLNCPNAQDRLNESLALLLEDACLDGITYTPQGRPSQTMKGIGTKPLSQALPCNVQRKSKWAGG